jgi:hypothetical protein
MTCTPRAMMKIAGEARPGGLSGQIVGLELALT